MEDLFEELECSSDVTGFMKRLSPEEAGWLSQFITKKCNRDRELSGEEIEMELKVCNSSSALRSDYVQYPLVEHLSSSRSAQLPSHSHAGRPSLQEACKPEGPTDGLGRAKLVLDRRRGGR